MKSKHHAKLLGALVAAVTAIAMMAPAAQAAVPAPPFEQFAGCPNPTTENPKITSCLRSVVTGGHFQMGSKDVPITNPIELTGGTELGFKNFDYNSEGGLKPAKQTVPGGIVGLTGLDWLVDLLNAEQLKLYAVTELVGTPKISITTLELPIKVHLINPVLGNGCYVGSNASPIVLNMTTGTTSPPPPNEPITGKAPELSIEPINKINLANNALFVDNSFAAPGVNGCTLNIGIIPVNINGLVNTVSGLPSAAGTNETTQEIDLEFTGAKRVYP